MRKFMIIAAMGFAAGCLMPITASFAAELSGSTSKDTLNIFERRGAGEPGDVRGEGAGHPVKADAPMTVARRGADDPKGHIRGEGAGHPLKADAPMTVARRGADDVGGRGEGAGHPVKSNDTFTVARRGADDPKGHIRGEGVGHPVKSTIETTTIG